MRKLQADALTPRSSPPAGTTNHGDGLDPRTGGELFLALLAVAPHREQVAVRPHRSGQPVALAHSGGVAPLRQSDQAPAVPLTPPEGRRPVPAPPGTAAGTLPRLATLWTAVLGETPPTGERDFFKLGGNSLSAVELMNAINTEFGLTLSVITLFDHPSLDDLAEFLETAGRSEDDHDTSSADHGGGRP
nr:acyl carrier protein [Amycolatopsis sp. SID8362]